MSKALVTIRLRPPVLKKLAHTLGISKKAKSGNLAAAQLVQSVWEMRGRGLLDYEIAIETGLPIAKIKALLREGLQVFVDDIQSEIAIWRRQNLERLERIVRARLEIATKSSITIRRETESGFIDIEDFQTPIRACDAAIKAILAQHHLMGGVEAADGPSWSDVLMRIRDQVKPALPEKQAEAVEVTHTPETVTEIKREDPNDLLWEEEIP